MMTEEQKKALSNLRKTLVACNRLNYCESAIAELEAALTQPASPALKLPDAQEQVLGVWNPSANEIAVRKLSGIKIVDFAHWHCHCTKEVVIRDISDHPAILNAPHTTPIEPICATGGAEWVKCSERMPEETEVFGGDDFSPEVLTINQYGEQWVGRTHWGKWIHTKHKDCVVQAWMPLPAAPEAE